MHSFLTAILPDIGIYYIVTPHPTGKGFIHYPCESIESMNIKANELDADSKTVYHACASFKHKSYLDKNGKTRFRTAENAGWAKSFWLDIDCGIDKTAEGKGYLTPKDAADALKIFTDTIDIQMPMVVASGGGLHCYWSLDETISKEEWKIVANKLKALTHSLKLIADDSRTTDIASVLRPISTHNWKPEHNGKEVKLKFTAKPVPFAQFNKVIDEAYLKFCDVQRKIIVGNSLATFITNDPETPENIARIKSALSAIDPNCDRAVWRDICFSVHSFGWSCSEQLARSWSKGELQ